LSSKEDIRDEQWRLCGFTEQLENVIQAIDRLCQGLSIAVGFNVIGTDWAEGSEKQMRYFCPYEGLSGMY
jgi:hypothetical protein